jgi:hypothetical protein
VARDIRDLRGHDLFRRFVLLNAMMTRPTEFPRKAYGKVRRRILWDRPRWQAALLSGRSKACRQLLESHG